MRHARRKFQFSRTSEHGQAMLAMMARNLLRHGRIHTTPAKAKAARRVVDRLITLGKEGSIHSRRQAYRLLQDRELVKRLFAEIAPRFLDCHGGYTRVLKLDAYRHGDGAPTAVLELTRLPAEPPKPSLTKPSKPQAPPTAPEPKAPKAEAAPKPKRFLEGLRGLFGKKKE